MLLFPIALATTDAEPIPRWPSADAIIEPVDLHAPRNLPRTVVFLMAGHANGKHRLGNIGVHGQVEAEVNLWTAKQVAARLEDLGWFEVILGRDEGEYPSYGARIARAEALGADVFIELHTDARGELIPWATSPHGWVYRNEGYHGFSVLFNEGGAVGPERRQLARAIGEQLAASGLPPFFGYANMYDDDDVRGVFIDRRGLMMLRRPKVPSVIIETHNAKDFEESLRWREPHVLDAFAWALAEAIRRFRTKE